MNTQMGLRSIVRPKKPGTKAGGRPWIHSRGSKRD